VKRRRRPSASNLSWTPDVSGSDIQQSHVRLTRRQGLQDPGGKSARLLLLLDESLHETRDEVLLVTGLAEGLLEDALEICGGTGATGFHGFVTEDALNVHAEPSDFD